MERLLIFALTQPWLWKLLGSALCAGATAAMLLGWRIHKVEGRIARRFDLEASVINALPDWMAWAVPESALGWTVAVVVLAAGLYMQWFARWVQRQIG